MVITPASARATPSRSSLRSFDKLKSGGGGGGGGEARRDVDFFTGAGLPPDGFTGGLAALPAPLEGVLEAGFEPGFRKKGSLSGMIYWLKNRTHFQLYRLCGTL
jgi:hypothetical protein